MPTWTSPSDSDPPGAAALDRLSPRLQHVVLWAVVILVLATFVLVVTGLGHGEACQCEGG